MVRENNRKEFVREDEMPKFGAGSEYGRQEKEEARRKKYGINTRRYNPDNQPWYGIQKCLIGSDCSEDHFLCYGEFLQVRLASLKAGFRCSVESVNRILITRPYCILIKSYLWETQFLTY